MSDVSQHRGDEAVGRRGMGLGCVRLAGGPGVFSRVDATAGCGARGRRGNRGWDRMAHMLAPVQTESHAGTHPIAPVEPVYRTVVCMRTNAGYHHCRSLPQKERDSFNMHLCSRSHPLSLLNHAGCTDAVRAEGFVSIETPAKIQNPRSQAQSRPPVSKARQSYFVTCMVTCTVR